MTITTTKIPGVRGPAGYHRACWWIALEDEPTLTDPDEVQAQLTVALVADLFDRTPREVALVVCGLRRVVARSA